MCYATLPSSLAPNHSPNRSPSILDPLCAPSVPKLSIMLLTVVQSRLHIFGIPVCCSSPTMASIFVPPLFFAHRIQVFSYVADHLSFANNSLLQMHPLLADILDQDPRILRSPRLSLCAALCRHLVITTRLVQPTYTFGPSSCCPIDHVTLSLSLYQPFVASIKNPCRRHLSLSSHPLASSHPRSHVVAVYPHLRCHPLHPRHESQHPSLAGTRPLEGVYCHEPCELPQQRRLYPIDF
jgi:hypothetical protein